MVRRTRPGSDATTARSATREPLSRDRVLTAAMRVADDEGIDGLTMRRLGQTVGVEAMTLYYHVGRKEELLAAIVDRAFGEIELPDPALSWHVGLRRCAISAHAVLERHPWATRLSISVDGIGVARLGYMESVLQCLRGAGFSPNLTHHAYHALDSHIVGSTLWAAGYQQVARETPDLATRALETLPLDDYPAMAEHIQQHITPDAEDDRPEFEFGLDLILEGLERLLEAGALGRLSERA